MIPRTLPCFYRIRNGNYPGKPGVEFFKKKCWPCTFLWKTQRVQVFEYSLNDISRRTQHISNVCQLPYPPLATYAHHNDRLDTAKKTPWRRVIKQLMVLVPADDSMLPWPPTCRVCVDCRVWVLNLHVSESFRIWQKPFSILSHSQQLQIIIKSLPMTWQSWGIDRGTQIVTNNISNDFIHFSAAD